MLLKRTSYKNIFDLSLLALLPIFLAACSSEQSSQTETESAPTAASTMTAEVPVVEQQAAPTPQAPSQQERAERERNKAIIASYMAVLGDSAAEQEFLAADYQMIRSEFHNLSYNADGSELADIAEPIQVAIPDRNDEIVELIGEGGTVVVQYQIQGTHQGNFYGIPAMGKSLDVEAIAIFTLAGGKIKDGWFMSDEVRLLNQLGTIMPARADGKIIVPPSNVALRTGDDILA